MRRNWTAEDAENAEGRSNGEARVDDEKKEEEETAKTQPQMDADERRWKKQRASSDF
jgi:hypothetical protein